MLSPTQIAGFFKRSYLKKEVNYEVYFWHTDKVKVYNKLILTCWVCVIKYAKSTKNKFAYLCIISRKEWDEVYFLTADKRKSFLQFDSITLVVHS